MELFKLQRLRASSVWNGLIIALGGMISLFAAFMLALEALWKALDPSQVFGCDVNEHLSCSTVASSWQSTLLHTPDGSPIPNAFIGLPAFAVIVTIGVIMACGWRPPAWFSWCFRGGVLVALLFSSWLLEQSFVSIHALCPWCLTMDAGMILCTIGVVRAWLLDGQPDHHSRAWRWTIGLESLLIEVVIIAVIILIMFSGYMKLM